MRVSVIVADSMVCVDSVCYRGFDLSDLASGVSAVQWYGNQGIVESTDSVTGLQTNTTISDLSEYQHLVDQWTARHDELMSAIAAEATQTSNPIPISVTPRQVRLLLLSQNLLADVEAMIALQDEATRITWEYAQEFRRDDPLLLTMAANLTPPLTSEQIDQFFVAAAQL